MLQANLQASIHLPGLAKFTFDLNPARSIIGGKFPLTTLHRTRGVFQYCATPVIKIKMAKLGHDVGLV
jgi:hypothetical protein